MPSTPPSISGLHALVPAGGPGSRLWPLSRADRPKFLLDLTGSGRSLLQQTWDRLAPLVPAERLWIVTGGRHAGAVAEQLPELPEPNLVPEPASRDTAAAICLGAAVVARRHPGAVVGAFPADHVIQNVPEFHRAVREAVAVAEAGYVVTIGIDPTHPSTALGYIQLQAPVSLDGAPSAYAVSGFVEKPDAPTAARYLGEGTWRWNAGMFIARAEVLLAELAEHKPALHAGICEIADAWDTDRREAVVAEVWPKLEKISIDYAVAEPAAAAGRVVVIPASLGWEDVGDWASLVSFLSSSAPPAPHRPAVLGDPGQVLGGEATGLVVAGGGRRIAVHGLEDVVVVDTPDVVLVTTRARALEVKQLVEQLRTDGHADLT